MVTLNPDDCIPQGVHEGYKKELTELFCCGLGVEKLDREALGRFKTLEVLWLNDNKLSKLKGVEDNFRLKHLYLHNNRIPSLTNSSCCLKELRHLQTLQLQGNMLQDLQATLKVLQRLTSLRQLNMQGNPLTNEQSYRAHVVHQLPWLELLDNFSVTELEKAPAHLLPHPLPMQVEGSVWLLMHLRPRTPPCRRTRPSSSARPRLRRRSPSTRSSSPGTRSSPTSSTRPRSARPTSPGTWRPRTGGAARRSARRRRPRCAWRRGRALR